MDHPFPLPKNMLLTTPSPTSQAQGSTKEPLPSIPMVLWLANKSALSKTPSPNSFQAQEPMNTRGPQVPRWALEGKKDNAESSLISRSNQDVIFYLRKPDNTNRGVCLSQLRNLAGASVSASRQWPRIWRRSQGHAIMTQILGKFIPQIPVSPSPENTNPLILTTFLPPML